MSATLTQLPHQPRAGLSTEEARRLLAQVGPNAIVEAKGPSHVRQFLANFVQLLAFLLWAGAALALVAGMPELSVAIVLVGSARSDRGGAQVRRHGRRGAAGDRWRPSRRQESSTPRDGDGRPIRPHAVRLPPPHIVQSAGKTLTDRTKRRSSARRLRASRRRPVRECCFGCGARSPRTNGVRHPCAPPSHCALGNRSG